HGQVGDLPPATVSEVSFIDPQLDAAQREAVARAVSTPDVCLIQGLPGTGKSRVLTEVLTQLAQRGQRVLLLSPTAAGLDRVLEPLVPRDGVCPVRCLAPGEMVESLPASLRSLTIEGRGRSFEQQTVPAARQLAAESRRAAEARRPLAPLCERLRRLAQEEQEAQAKRAALAEERSRVESLLDTDPALAEALLELREARDRGCAAVQA